MLKNEMTHVLAFLLMGATSVVWADTSADTSLDSLLQDSATESTGDVLLDKTESTAAAEQPSEELPVIAVPLKVENEVEKPTERRTTQHIEEIVVTATKREKSSREIPIAITALRGEDLEKAGARDLQDYVMKAPGLTMDESEYGPASGRRMTVRGIGPGTGSMGNQTVGQFIGDAPMTDPYSNYGTPDLDPFDLKTVEVLRGPQGTTFGASALNGAIRYVPNEPVLQEWSGRGFVDYSRLHEGGSGATYGAAFNAPIGDQIAFRASGVLQNVPGMYDNLQRHEDNANSARKWSARGALRWEPTEKFAINLMALKQNTHSNDVLVADNGEGRLENNNKPGPSSIDFDFGMANADLRYKFDDWGTLVYQFTKQTKQSSGEFDPGVKATGSMGIESLRLAFSMDTQGDIHELRFVSEEGDRWDWMAGLFRRDYKASIKTAYNLAQGVDGILGAEVDPFTAKETAAYGELVRRLGSHWEVTLGGRYYKTSLEGVVKSIVAQVLPLITVPVYQAEDGFNPRLSIAYTAEEHGMAYLTIARGFQFGGINTPLSIPILSSASNPVTGTPVPPSFSSSVLWSSELGVRTDWFDRTLQLDLAVFNIDWSKAQLQQSSGGIYSNDYLANIGKIRSRGVEGSFTWLTPLEGLSVNMVGSYTRAMTASDYESAGTNIPKGSPLPAVPKVQTTATLAYNTSVGPWVGGGSISHAYWGPAYSDIRKSYTIYDFSTLGLNFNVARPDLPSKPAVTFSIANLRDERGVVGRDTPTGGASGAGVTAAFGPYWTYIRPRTLSLRFTAAFD